MVIARPLGAALDPHQIAKSIPLSRDAKLRAEQRFVELGCTGIMRATSIGERAPRASRKSADFVRTIDKADACVGDVRCAIDKAAGHVGEGPKSLPINLTLIDVFLGP